MITAIIIFYSVPMLFVALYFWFDAEIKTVGDFLKYWWIFLFPIFNLIALFVIIMHYLIENQLSNSIVDSWNKFMDIKIK
jgi:hypothetical protein